MKEPISFVNDITLKVDEGGIAFTLRSRDYKDQQGVITERQMDEKVYEIGNGQTCNTEIHDICGTLDCMHDQKALLIRGGDKWITKR